MSQFYNDEINLKLEKFLKKMQKADFSLNCMFIDLLDMYIQFGYNQSKKDFYNDFEFIYSVNFGEIKNVFLEQNVKNIQNDIKIIEKYKNINIFKQDISLLNLQKVFWDFNSNKNDLKIRSFSKYMNTLSKYEEEKEKQWIQYQVIKNQSTINN